MDVQRKEAGESEDDVDVHDAAAEGISGSSSTLPDMATDTIRTGPPSSRFAGWFDATHVAVEIADAVSSLSLADGSMTAADRANVLPARTPDVPAWAEHIVVGPAGTITAAERPADCTPALRVWTASGGARTLKRTCPDDAYGWSIGGDTAIALTSTLATVYRASTGKQLAAIRVEASASKKNPNELRAVAASDDGTSIALLWRAPVFDDTEDPNVERTCPEAECTWTYTLDRWTLAAKPTRTQRIVLTGSPTDAITFDRSGKRLFVGLRDGAIHAWTGEKETTITKHAFEVSRISVGPGDQWVLSEDLAGEQRIWRAK